MVDLWWNDSPSFHHKRSVKFTLTNCESVVLKKFKEKRFLNGESMVGRWWGISTIVSPSK
jgi:hypothetical protein